MMKIFPPPWFQMFIISTTVILLFHCFEFSNAANNETDLAALHAFKAGLTDDPLGALSSWNDTTHFCQWSGVYCSRRHQRVTTIKLPSLKLTGTLSPFVGNLSFLRVLRLQNNSFSGTIPPELGRLFRLQYLVLNNNSFVGEIPSNITNCSHLIGLDISNNELVGRIPRNLGLLVNLKILGFRDNYLTGNIPSSLGNLTSLSTVDLMENNFNETIPDSVGKLQGLTYLLLGSNQLSGMVPPSIFNISSLAYVDLGVNLLEGSLPLDFGILLPNLQVFYVNNNRFTGSIPPSISNSSSLAYLQLDDNNFQGQVPSLHSLERLRWLMISKNSLGTGQPIDLAFVSSLANATMLDTLVIGVNNFEGSFPSSVCNFSMLMNLELDKNRISGNIPVCIESLTYLRELDASSNQLSGDIPSNIGKLQHLGGLYLGDNLLSGNIPPSIGNLTLLVDLNLSHNHLQGHIPSTLGSLRYLLELDLSQNSLIGGIPEQLFDHSPFSRSLNLSYNHLTGSLPVEIGQLKDLRVLDVSGAMLSGEISSTLGACTSLGSLYMRQNFFRGPIPETFSSLGSLTQLDLSLNNLSGKIPDFLASLPLQMLNLSYNNLQGEVPIGGVFNNLTGLSIVGNKGLCGGIPALKLPPCNHMRNQKRELAFKIRLTVAILCGISGVILVVALISLFTFHHRKRRHEGKGEPGASITNWSYQSLLKATNGFSSENVIGSGAFGVVYKGTLEQDGTTVAIKVFNLEHRGASRSFMAECEVLKNVKHRNLVKVNTACLGVDYQGNDFKALVYAYMENGSLEDWLHQTPTSIVEGTSSDLRRNLNLLQRFDIVLDVALALDYLHHGFGVSIVHCDLKPSNVLLDNEMVAHVGDFGLAKFLSQGISDSNGTQSSSIGVGGTVGYAPPEYGMGNEPSTYGDVYSFGILVLEMFTGRRPTDNIFGEGRSLNGFVKAALPYHTMEVVDHTLLKDIVREDISTSEVAYNFRRNDNSVLMLEALGSILEIAVSCSTELPHDRPDMANVAARLSSI